MSAALPRRAGQPVSRRAVCRWQYHEALRVRDEAGTKRSRFNRQHQEKACTVEQVHQVLKNELVAAALPSRKFGANAAWFLDMRLRNRIIFDTFALLAAISTIDTHEGLLS